MFFYQTPLDFAKGMKLIKIIDLFNKLNKSG